LSATTPPGGRDGFDEAYRADGDPRPHYERLLAALEGADLLALRDAAQQRADAEGMSFGSDPFRIDPVPRLFTGEAWDALAAGLQQRARALNAFVADAYGAREIVAAGVVPEDLVDAAEGYSPSSSAGSRRWPHRSRSRGWTSSATRMARCGCWRTTAARRRASAMPPPPAAR
jgi:uncharacterized circularly permuted ATP-grasp superfamily protein